MLNLVRSADVFRIAFLEGLNDTGESEDWSDAPNYAHIRKALPECVCFDPYAVRCSTDLPVVAVDARTGCGF